MHTPTREERLKPLELLGLAAVMALFCGLAVLLATRSPFIALLFAAVAFIVSLLVLAAIAITGKPTPDELAELRGEGGDDPGAATRH